MSAYLEISLRPGDYQEPYTDDELRYVHNIYVPKDCDYNNLQRFAESFDPRWGHFRRFIVLMFLRLRNGGLALIHFTQPRLTDYLHEIHLNGDFMENSGLSLNCFGAYSALSARIFLPQPRMQLNESRVDCDTILDFVVRRWWMDEDCFLNIDASRTGHEQVQEHFSDSSLLASLENVPNLKLEWCLSHVGLSDDVWRGISTFEFKIQITCSMVVPRIFWSQTQAKEMKVGDHCNSRYYPSEQELEFALSGLQSRATPIDKVCLLWHIELLTVSDAENWASALKGIRRFEVSEVHATTRAWCHFWLSMAKNVSLVSFNISVLVFTNYSEDLFDELPRPLSVIRECLQRNLFLECISLNGAMIRRYQSEWNENVEPLLAMNRRHEHRLAPGETRLWVIHDRLLQIYTHPKKLYIMLQDFPRAIIPRSLSERLTDLEKWKDDAMES